jgi:hypothetical protein
LIPFHSHHGHSHTFTVKDNSDLYTNHLVTISEDGIVKAYALHLFPDGDDLYVYGMFWSKTQDPRQVQQYVMEAVAEEAKIE